ncbi:MAG: hypothetical protein AUG51_03875 [Acidobacteria bacterium 13_1_20CM_3_53_8]|nr:MAG: hypothetical protein AUG51_03875 [Acidobacteria bacterium 13_1_20CM_3_53_8]
MSDSFILDESFAGKRVALGVTGGIAAYKAAEILRGLQRAGCVVRVCMTKRACEFVTPLTFRALSGSHVIVDDYAPDNPDPIAHITFSQSVDLFLIAPATASIIAKFANGIADDFLSSTYLASTAPVIIAPAMNTTMWQHPATRRNLETLRADGVHIIEPDSGEMACGTFGPGRLSEPEIIVSAALSLLGKSGKTVTRDLADERVLITAGATREAIDPVRFISNRSVAGVTSAEPPAQVRVLKATSAEEMRAAVMKEIGSASVFIGAAAVADYKPVAPASEKIKKTDAELTLKLERTEDILAEVSLNRHEGLIVVGFAAESSDVIANAREKFRRKNLDIIVANDITGKGAGFDAETNIVTLLARETLAPIELPLMSKLEAAHRILDEIVRLRDSNNRLKIHSMSGAATSSQS